MQANRVGKLINFGTQSSIYWLYQETSVLYPVDTGYIKELVYCI